MKTKQGESAPPADGHGVPRDSHTLEHGVEGGLSGAVAGAVFGAAAGPAGVAAGALIGGVAGALAGAALDRGGAADAERASELDDAIGVTEGDLGAPNLKHPAARIGAYSAASAGSAGDASEAEDAPAEGGIETPK